jgi:hypothetical protein
MVAMPLAFVTTKDLDLLFSLEKIRIPFDYAFISIMALRFVPLINASRHRIADAQRLRGTELDRVNPLAKLRSLISILVPMVIGALKMTTQLQNAIESRAYVSGRKRTSLQNQQSGFTSDFTRKDKALVVSALTVTAIAVFLHLAGSVGIVIDFISLLMNVPPPHLDTTIIPRTIPSELFMVFMEFLYNLAWPLHPLFQQLGYQFNFQIPSPPVPQPSPV